MAAANEELVKLVTNQARDLLAQIRKDIEESSTLTDDDRKNCEAICQRVETEHKRLKSEFLRESLNLIDQALATSDEQRLKQIHQTWSWALDNVTHQCENLAGPLIEVLQVLTRNNPEMETKYAAFVTGTVVSSVLTGVVIGIIIAHYRSSSPLQSEYENIPGVTIGLLLAIACATGCIIGKITSTNIRSVYQKWLDSVRYLLVKCFPSYAKNPIDISSEPEIAKVIKNSMDTLNINEELWRNHEALEIIKQSVQSQLQCLQEQK
jgi:F0F1-type ATP synthase assembly protein I